MIVCKSTWRKTRDQSGELVAVYRSVCRSTGFGEGRVKAYQWKRVNCPECLEKRRAK